MFRPATFILFLIFTSLVTSICYFPNGDIANNNFPCNGDAENSHCCNSGYVCYDGGLCLPWEGYEDKYVRGSCTDQTWRSGACPSYCVTNPRGGAGIGQCPGLGDDDTDVLFCTTGSEEADALKCSSGDTFEFPCELRLRL